MKLNKKIKTTLPLAAFAGLALTASSSHAAIIGFEAESGTLGADFDPAQADAGALGGFYITTETEKITGNNPETEARTVSYSLNVAAGTYDVYVRGRVGPGNANDDSFFYANAFGDADPTVTTDWQQINGMGSFGVPQVSFGWSSALTATVTSTGGTVQWEIGPREDGFDMDAFALVSTGQVVTDAELSAAVAVPEPSTTALLGLGGLALILRRRKG
jgi:endo-1,4-beta-xylanase